MDCDDSRRRGAKSEGHEMKDFIAQRVHNIPPSGLRKFFEILATVKDVISLSLGEPDFVTPRPILEAGDHHRATKAEAMSDFYSADEDLLEAAEAEGLPIENPNLHP